MKTARFLLILAGIGLNACSNMYYERKDQITLANGDSVQANKAGLMEIADIFVINKADRKGALFYAAMRSLTLRKLRLPPPRYKAGGRPVTPKKPKAPKAR